MNPTILVFGGHDPTGGAGIQADIETIGVLGGHALTIPTALTTQNSQRVFGFEPVAPQQLRQQAEMLLEEFHVDVIKIGMVANRALCSAIAGLLQQHPTLPVVLDPVLAGGGGGALSGDSLVDGIRTQLIPKATLATPNRSELQRLVPECDNNAARSQLLLASGCGQLLVTGTDHPTADEDRAMVHHHLIQQSGSQTFHTPRLPHSYHGSGCTLASAIATRIGVGDSVVDAVASALDFTLQTLQHGYRPAAGQHLPNRFFQP